MTTYERFRSKRHIPVVLAGMMAALLTPGQASAQVTFPRIVGSQAQPEPNSEISPARREALRLFRSLTGVSLPIDDQRLKDMEAKIAAGDRAGAAGVATSDPYFYNVRVKNLAKQMSTREESATVDLNDFVATFVGVVRDSDTTPASQLLTGNFLYKADPALSQVTNAAGAQVAGVRDNEGPDRITSNNHYMDIERNNLNMKSVLMRVDGQKFADNANAVQTLPDKAAAGVLSSRAFIGAHAVAGTNRRLIEYTFRQFLCVRMEDWSDITQPDDKVARDVDRAPGGDNNKFQTSCKGCHSQMDALRPAFAFVDFTTQGNQNAFRYTEGTVPAKLNRNNTVFPSGFVTANDNWLNYANGSKGMSLFGWKGAQSGTSIKGLGAMVAESDGFARCMTKRVFTEVCRRAPAALEEPMINSIASGFQSDNLHLRRLFETVALRPECQQER